MSEREPLAPPSVGLALEPRPASIALSRAFWPMPPGSNPAPQPTGPKTRVWLSHRERKAAGVPMKPGFQGMRQRQRAAKQAANAERRAAARAARASSAPSSSAPPMPSDPACPSTPTASPSKANAAADSDSRS